MGSGAILWALANPKLDEREVLQARLDVDEDLVADRPAPAATTGKLRGLAVCGKSLRGAARASDATRPLALLGLI